MCDNHPHFKDFADEPESLEGKKKKIEEILNIEILVIGFRVSRSKLKEGEYLTLQFEKGREKHILFTGSEVLMKQIVKYKDKIPFYTKMVKHGDYYTFS